MSKEVVPQQVFHLERVTLQNQENAIINYTLQWIYSPKISKMLTKLTYQCICRGVKEIRQ